MKNQGSYNQDNMLERGRVYVILVHAHNNTV